MWGEGLDLNRRLQLTSISLLMIQCPILGVTFLDQLIYTTVEDSRVELPCSVSRGHPHPDITWLVSLMLKCSWAIAIVTSQACYYCFNDYYDFLFSLMRKSYHNWCCCTITYTINQNTGSLILHDVRESTVDGVSFRCVASNEAGSDTSANVTVAVKESNGMNIAN